MWAQDYQKTKQCCIYIWYNPDAEVFRLKIGYSNNVTDLRSRFHRYAPHGEFSHVENTSTHKIAEDAERIIEETFRDLRLRNDKGNFTEFYDMSLTDAIQSVRDIVAQLELDYSKHSSWTLV